jgi:hypothetical protein
MPALGHQCRISNVRGWSGYPPGLSVKADIRDGQSASASSRISLAGAWRQHDGLGAYRWPI